MFSEILFVITGIELSTLLSIITISVLLVSLFINLLFLELFNKNNTDSEKTNRYPSWYRTDEERYISGEISLKELEDRLENKYR